MSPTTDNIYAHPEFLAVILGLTNHLFFNRYEPFGRTVPYAIAVLFIEPVLLCLVQAYISPIQWPRYLIVYGAFYTSLLSSIILYRISPIHPLAKVPGPTMHKISKLWSVWICWQGRQHTEFKAMHDKYGPVVRTGPNEISIIDPSAVDDVLGKGGLPKGKYYLARQDERAPSNLLTLNGEKHKARRQVWNRGFNSDAVVEYGDILAETTMQLVEGIQARSESQGEVDLTTWFNYFSFDFMAKFVFGGGSDLLTTGEDKKGILELLEHHMMTGALVAHIPWFFYLGERIPGATQATLKMRAFAMEWATKRLSRSAETKDLWYHLTGEATRETGEQPQMAVKEVIADALMAIVAGADTTSVALTNFFYLMLKHPEDYRRVQEEIDRVYADADATDVSKQSGLKYLSACLDESLRLLPPGLTGGPRQVPQGGRMIAGYFLPAGTQVYLPPYVMHRNPECFSPRPDDFEPSRWLNSNPDVWDRHNKKAFLSFSYGPANCVGRKLARQEMLMAISSMMQRFEFTFAKEFDWEHWPKTMEDFFTTSRGPMKVIARRKL
ncbi:high nitrogen upregulated cytochrome P450 monooxygenase 2 [Lentinula raphanica]|uniref:High nitrogen upregulated cytochrome P450 monooxygenase 2 n=1 Tax=Lentinula raphanica TaxID=153919 RepID=A0AA38PKI7_9AGAR|nr:high nitrogen upregulated cytochrome P450 monooxygenase 2 [Lentinula raphanica]KAJ3967927.1 high nitrogen upregulated cytochrome P450 monooxygenase 2 [Lentinula raphanica]